MFKFLGKLLDSNEKEVKKLTELVLRINDLDSTVKKLKPADFAKKTAEFKERLSHGASLTDILPEAYALVREASFRTIGERHFDVNLWLPLRFI